MVMSREAATPRGERRAARIAGALFLIAMAASLFGGAVVSAALPAPGNSGALDARGLLSGGLIELVNAFAVVGIAACLFPALKRHGERAALGYLASGLRRRCSARWPRSSRSCSSRRTGSPGP